MKFDAVRKIATDAINPDVYGISSLSDIEWEPLIFSHKRKSSQVYESSDRRFFRKDKKRSAKLRNLEYYSLLFWDRLLFHYRNIDDVKIFSPRPILASGNSLVMDLIYGLDLDGIVRSGTMDERGVKRSVEYIGSLFQIKENEDIIHRDFDLRHLMLDGGLHVIDLEHSMRGDAGKENSEFLNKFSPLFIRSIGKENFYSALYEGRMKVSRESYSGITKSEIRNYYGDRFEGAAAQRF